MPPKNTEGGGNVNLGRDKLRLVTVIVRLKETMLVADGKCILRRSNVGLEAQMNLGITEGKAIGLGDLALSCSR